MKKSLKKKQQKQGTKAVRKPRFTRSVLSDFALRLMTEYDYRIILLVAALSMFGVVMVFSAGYYSTLSAGSGDPYYFLKRQVLFTGSGFAIMLLVARFDYHRAAKKPWLFVLISIALLLLLWTPLGVTVNFARRWISIAGIRVTPSEISKLAMIIFTAGFLAEDSRRAKSLRGIGLVAVVMLFHAGVIIKQPNLSTAIVLCMIMVGIMFVAGLPLRYIGLMGGAVVGGMIYILTFLQNTHWYARLTNWRNPFADAQGEGYQVSQSIIALGNGGFKGLGLGNSIAKNLYLPEPQNDFILAIIGEELGFIGIFCLMVVYLVLIWRCFLVAAGAKDKLGLYMASGIAIMLALQVIINVAVVTASMPATGITLPFISYGGTSIWIFMMAMGILLNISKKEG